ncbi:hypothetical protein BCR39DRAFT_533918 [Naematelia encephala]|uniref:Uncharacterized protein n=1 Tax=Naematelia encephala TaxID=71784 RepID=A0A1Y2B2S8_9TREE|nr:hypothetical protein BCR39DRAFT_533918 [Naematelia encephala]
MSLSGSTGEDYNKTGDGQLHYDEPTGPDPTPENPGGVFPQTGTVSADAGSMPGSGAPDHGGDVRGVFGNPQVFSDTFGHLSGEFSTAINAVKGESGSGLGSVAKALIERLEAMRDEIDGWRKGEGLAGAAEGEKNDEVERAEGDGGGLYKD